MSFDKPTPNYSYHKEGWYRVIGVKRGTKRNGKTMLHYFFNNKCICNIKQYHNMEGLSLSNSFNIIKCKNCLRLINTYNDLRNIPI